MNVAPAQSTDLAKLLQHHIAGEVFVDSYRCALYSTDASIYRVQPQAVVVPRDAHDVQVALQIAAQTGTPVTPRGGGTSLAGQAIGPGLVLDFTKYCNQIVSLDPAARTAVVQPGVILDDLNAAAAKHGLQFGPDVSTSNRASLGGMIGNNSAGSRSLWYGKTVDHVTAIDLLLSDGQAVTFSDRITPSTAVADRAANLTAQVRQLVSMHQQEIIARYPRILRRVSGYNLDEFVPELRSLLPTPLAIAEMQRRMPENAFNLSKLIVGAEGTLGVMTAATVQLVPLPAARGIVALHFDSLTSAIAAVVPILSSQPSAIELLDGQIVRLARQSLEYRDYLDFVLGDPACLLLVEWSGDSPDEIRRQAERLLRELTGFPGLCGAVPAFEPELCRHIWSCRKAALPLLYGLPGERKPVAFVEDAAVAPQQLAEFIARFQEILVRHHTAGAYYGHASVGCVHIRPLLDLKQAADLQTLAAISREVAELVAELGGAMSGEHGDGRARSYLNEQLFGPQLYDAFRQVKRIFDPQGFMNPGIIVDGPAATADQRLGPGYRTLPLATTFDFSRQGGLAAAIELCNGSGVCRKTQTGTMCPSFMATGDEEHSTRGRANALRLALSGEWSPTDWTDPKVRHTLDLCLECKGCKAECPSNVDVAKLKMEFLSHYHQRHGTTRGERFIGQLAKWNRLGSAWAPMSTWLLQFPPARWLSAKALGLDPRRRFPRFARESFSDWFAARPVLDTARPAVVLLADCVTSYTHPQINRAAVTVLEALGYQVYLAGLPCCGRTLCSQGFLQEAKQLAEENLARLDPWLQSGVPIVATEPSCWGMFVDEYQDLIPGPAARTLAAQTQFIDAFVWQRRENLVLQPLAKEALLHGHCHQKALGAFRATQDLVKLVPDLHAEVVDSGCCGMAGAFGYRHHDLSLQIGERVLFPAIRQRPGTLLLAPGCSCRQQIQDGTDRGSLAPIELICQQLASSKRSDENLL